MKKNGDQDKELNEVTLGVKSVRAGPYGKLRITLDNGQVWIQIDDKMLREKKADKALIRSAALGSYKMKLDDGRTFRVRREQ